MAWDGSVVWTVPLSGAVPNELLVEGASVVLAGGASYYGHPTIGGRTLTTTGWNIAWIARIAAATGALDRVGDFAVGSDYLDEGFATGVAARTDGTFVVAGAYRQFIEVPGLFRRSDDSVRGGYFVEVSFP